MGTIREIPTPADKGFTEAFDCFKYIVNKLRSNIPTYQRFNLKPLLHKALPVLCTMSWAIYHPINKGLYLYIVYWLIYTNQGIKEHLNVTKNHRRLSPIKATAKLVKQQKLLYEAFAECKD